MPLLSFEESIRILLHGVSGANANYISVNTGICHRTIKEFLSGNRQARPETVDKLGMFVWRRINPHILISEEDKN